MQVVRDGTGYALAGTEVSMNDVRPGTTWQIHIEISDRGQAMKLYIDGELIAGGEEVKDEPRRTVTVARNEAEGETYLRIVNAMDEAVSVDVSQILAELGVNGESLTAVKTTVLEGADPYAGEIGKASPTVPVEIPLDLTDGTYVAPAWSFTIIVLND